MSELKVPGFDDDATPAIAPERLLELMDNPITAPAFDESGEIYSNWTERVDMEKLSEQDERDLTRLRNAIHPDDDLPRRDPEAYVHTANKPPPNPRKPKHRGEGG